jgi:hypothetical protein
MERIQSTLTLLTIAVDTMESCGIIDSEVTTTSADRFGISVMLDKSPKAYDFINKLTAKLDLIIEDTRAHTDEERGNTFLTTKFETPAGRSVDICLVKESK